jgi:hypothetical protein
MYGVFKSEVGGALIWLATVDTDSEAKDIADGTVLRDEECVMVMALGNFRQQLDEV